MRLGRARRSALLCGRKPSDAHHIRFVQPRALGRNSSDEFTVPLCRSHHRAVHRAGNEQAWWQTAGIDPLKVARKLWKHTRTGEGRLEPGLATSRTAGSERGHPAKLNFGDCFAYALAKVTAEPLLFKGDDFARTDIEPARQRG
jgi:hypothetical protein